MGADLDADALMAASFTQKARDRLMKEHPDLQARLDLLRNLWRFDPEKDLHGITVYGTRLKKDTGVAVIHAQVDQKLLLDLAKAAPDHEVTTYGQYELHTWRKDAHKLDHAAFFKPDVLVFGASLDELKAALDVLNGTKPNYAAANEKLLDLSPSGAIFVAGARDISSAEVPHESPLVKHAESFLLVLERIRAGVPAGIADDERRPDRQADQDRGRRRPGCGLADEDRRPRCAEDHRRCESDPGRQVGQRRGAGARRAGLARPKGN